MEIRFLSLCMRGVRLAAWARPLQVDRNDQGIAIASSSFFIDARLSGGVWVGGHGRLCSRLLYHDRGDFIQIARHKLVASQLILLTFL